MKIKDRIALQFTLIVASILIVFSALVYSTSANYRRDEYFERLRDKARTTCRFLIEVKEIDMNLLKIIDRNTITAMIDEKVLIFDQNNKMIYSSLDDKPVSYNVELLERVREEKEIRVRDGENELLGLLYEEGEFPIVVLASAYDEFGLSKLNNLRNTIGWALLAGIALTVGLSVYFAGNSLKPIADINMEVSSITAQNLETRLHEGNRKDEIAQLAINFNQMLQRLSLAFEQQRSFVSHASHELRTPIAALKSEVQLGEQYAAGKPELQEIFQNLSLDTERLIQITNNLLLLARSFESLNKITTAVIRIEDLLFEAKEELESRSHDYHILIDYESFPQDESSTLVDGNKELIKVLFSNLMDNACKYSEDKAVRVLVSTDRSFCTIRVIDKGIGIDTQDIPLIFNPFYRAENAAGYLGFGIGLSICQRIVEAHRGTLTVESQKGTGSTFIVKMPNKSVQT